MYYELLSYHGLSTTNGHGLAFCTSRLVLSLERPLRHLTAESFMDCCQVHHGFGESGGGGDIQSNLPSMSRSFFTAGHGQNVSSVYCRTFSPFWILFVIVVKSVFASYIISIYLLVEQPCNEIPPFINSFPGFLFPTRVLLNEFLVESMLLNLGSPAILIHTHVRNDII